MKSAKTKYCEAVERNLTNASRKRGSKYHSLGLAKAKRMLGIRSNDDVYNRRVEELCAKPEAQ